MYHVNSRPNPCSDKQRRAYWALLKIISGALKKRGYGGMWTTPEYLHDFFRLKYFYSLLTVPLDSHAFREANSTGNATEEEMNSLISSIAKWAEKRGLETGFSDSAPSR